MANPRQLWVLAGGNGAGKTTFYNLHLAKYGIKFVNADLIAIDDARILDNSSRDNPFQQIIVMKAKNYEAKADPLPKWARDLLPT